MTNVLLARPCYPLPCFILYSNAKFACYSRCFLTSYFCIPVSSNEKDIFGVLVLKGLVQTAWQKPASCDGPRRSMAERSYPTSEVRGSS